MVIKKITIDPINRRITCVDVGKKADGNSSSTTTTIHTIGRVEETNKTDNYNNNSKNSSTTTNIADHDQHGDDQAVAKSSGSTAADNDGLDERKLLKVLIVDDHPALQEQQSSIAKDLGLETQIAENGQIAVDLHRSGASFDLILIDLEMPVMNGIRATKELRAMGVDTMIVGVTATMGGPDRSAFEQCGVDACYTKYMSKEQLSLIVNEVKRLCKMKIASKGKLAVVENITTDTTANKLADDNLALIATTDTNTTDVEEAKKADDNSASTAAATTTTITTNTIDVGEAKKAYDDSASTPTTTNTNAATVVDQEAKKAYDDSALIDFSNINTTDHVEEAKETDDNYVASIDTNTYHTTDVEEAKETDNYSASIDDNTNTYYTTNVEEAKEVDDNHYLELMDTINTNTTGVLEEAIKEADGYLALSTTANYNVDTHSVDVEEAKKAEKKSSTTTSEASAGESSSGTTSSLERKLKVLIVEDSPIFREQQSLMAKRFGLEPHFAENGQIAVDLHRSWATFDLILMDLEMPVMNGIQATKELRGLGVDTMIVGLMAASASPVGPIRQAFEQSGLSECYTKPMTIEQFSFLVNVVKQLIKEKEAQPQADIYAKFYKPPIRFTYVRKKNRAVAWEN